MTNVDVHAQSVRKWLHCDIALGLNKTCKSIARDYEIRDPDCTEPLLIHYIFHAPLSFCSHSLHAVLF